MKKTLFFTLAVLALTVSAQAAFVGQSDTPVTINDAKELHDDMPVRLKGKITKSLGDDKYIFADDTGTIIIEIDQEDWNGLDVTANDLIIIDGETDKGFLSTKIDVNSVQLAK